jgi:2-polyprenyl-6-methoxyphenol hydroxylase-like FAD-dependent oxidoreductase
MAALLLDIDGVDVVDRNTGPVTESRAVVVQARTAELWDKVGLADRLLSQGAQVRGAAVLIGGRDLTPGRSALDLATAGAGLTPYPRVMVFGQDQTERMLSEELEKRAVPVRRQVEVRELSQHDEHVELRVRGADSADGVIRARYVIGADGAHSTVRHQIGAGFDGAAHPGAFFLADTAVTWDRGYGDALTVALDDRGGMVLFVPMRDPGGASDRFRVFGSLSPASADSHEVTLADVQRRLDDGTGITARLHDPRWVALYRLHSRMADTFALGRVFLAGDAAHIHTPTGGQGMNTGLQDAFNLAWKLSAVLRGHARPQLLDTYDPERRPVARALLNGTDSAFSVISANGPVTRVLRPIAARALPALLRLPGIGRRLFTMISQIYVRYPDSPAVAGIRVPHAGPGDRAPYAPLTADPAGNVFELLSGTDHHLLAFVARHPDARVALARVTQAATQVSLPIQVHRLDPDEQAAYRAYRVEQPCAVLVRPDGYIAWRGTLDDVAAFSEYLTRWYSSAAAPSMPPPGAAPLPEPGTYRIDPAASGTS